MLIMIETHEMPYYYQLLPFRRIALGKRRGQEFIIISTISPSVLYIMGNEGIESSLLSLHYHPVCYTLWETKGSRVHYYLYNITLCVIH